MEPVEIAAVAKPISGFSISLTMQEVDVLRQLAIQHRTSPAALAQLAVRQMLTSTKTGAAPFIAPSTLDNAVEVTCLGNEV